MNNTMGSTLPLDADRVIVSVNPMAGATSAFGQVRRLVDLLGRQGFRPEVLTDLAEVGARANQWQSEGRLRALVGVGGDGTAAELVNRTQPGVPITMLQAGTENLLARHLDMGRSPEDVCQTVKTGRLLTLDAGRAADRVFLLMVSCGFDADVVHRLHRHRSGHIRGYLAYLRPILQSVRHYGFPEIRVYCEFGDDPVAGGPPQERNMPAGWVLTFNLPCYGGGFRVAPQADATDGLLDLCVFRRASFWHGLRFAAGVIARRHHRMADCTIGRVRRLRITSEEPVPYQVDGDPGGLLPLDIETLPGRLTMIVPSLEDCRA
jgi:diacylglycerol kinase (ATP)